MIRVGWSVSADTPTEQTDQDLCALLCTCAHWQPVKWETAQITRRPDDVYMDRVEISAELGQHAPRTQVLRS